jgi:hypothetical protein
MRVSTTAQTMLLQRRRNEREHCRKEQQERIQHKFAAMSSEEVEQWQDEIIAKIGAFFRARIINKYERRSPEERGMTAEQDKRILESPPLHLRQPHAHISERESEAIMAYLEAKHRPQALAEYLALPPRERRAEARKAAIDHERHEAERQARLMGSARG